MKIAVAGIGYVGVSLAILLAKNNEVAIVDVIPEKVEMLNKQKVLFKDPDIEKYLEKGNLKLYATLNWEKAYKDAEYVIIATPTNFDPEKNFFNTTTVEQVIQQVLKVNTKAVIVIKSTLPIGHTRQLQEQYKHNNFIFSPEFLRESQALHDNLYPSRIIVGYSKKNNKMNKLAKKFAFLLQQGAIKKNVDVLYMGLDEAEAVKLFSNTYLALRISFFNELDTYAEVVGLNTKQIIEGVCKDPRIGMYYNNPSFGYGGYCLPKDTKQLLANYCGIPQNLISAIVKSNQTRKQFIAKKILNKIGHYNQSLIKEKKDQITIGVYRLIMKAFSDNFRESSVFEIIKQIENENVNIIIYEPLLENTNYFYEYKVVNDLIEFKLSSDYIIANRYDKALDDIKYKVYTRDLFNID